VSSLASYKEESFGYYTVGPIDANATVNGNDRFACLQVRCPGITAKGQPIDVFVNVSVDSGVSASCRIT